MNEIDGVDDGGGAAFFFLLLHTPLAAPKDNATTRIVFFVRAQKPASSRRASFANLSKA